MLTQNMVEFPDHNESDIMEGYQMIVFISEYYMNSISVVAFYMNLIEKALPIEIDTTVLNAALLG